MTVTLTTGVPGFYQIPGIPGLSITVPTVNQTQFMFNSTDSDVNSTGLYFLKDPTVGSQNWLKFASSQEIAALTAKTFSYPTRSLNTIFQPSATRDTFVSYATDISCTLSLSGGQTGTVFLEVSLSSTFASGIQAVNSSQNANTGTLTIGLNIVQTITGVVTGIVQAGYYCRIRTANTTGTPTFTFKSGQEVNF